MAKIIVRVIQLLICALLLFSCSVTGKPGVIKETKNGRWVWGNAKHKQMRYDAKMKKDSAILVKQ